MTHPDRPRHIEVGDGGQPVAAAEVTTAAGADGTVRASLHASAGHLTPGSRASLVDAVMDLPEVQASTRLEATIPLGDGELLGRLRERTWDTVTRPAGPLNFTGPAIRSSRNTRVASRPRSRPATYQRPCRFTTPHGSSSRRCGSLRPAAR